MWIENTVTTVLDRSTIGGAGTGQTSVHQGQGSPGNSGLIALLQRNDWFSWLVVTISALLLITPCLFWTGFVGQKMNVGGDNSLLYFEYPLRWLPNTALPAMSQGLSGYSPIPQYAPLAIAISVFHVIHLNAEGVIFGLVLASSFLGTVLVALHILAISAPRWNDYSRKCSALFAGVIVISAPLLAQTLWTTILPELFWMVLLPWLLLLFLNYLQTERIIYCVYAAALTTILSIALPDAPVGIGCLLATILILVSLRAAGSIRLRFSSVVKFGMAIVLASAFWLIPLFGAFLLPQLQVQSALSANGKQGATSIVSSLAPLQNAKDAISLQQSSGMMEAYRWPQLVPAQWSESLIFLGLVPIVLMMCGLVIAVDLRKTQPRLTRLVILLILSTSLLLLLFCPRLPGGSELSLALIRHVPGWTSERNFYEAFGFPYVFLFAITTAIATGVVLNFLTSSIRTRRYHKTVQIGMLVIIVCLPVYNIPLFRGDYFRLPYTLGSNANRVMQGLGPDYLNLLSALEKLPPGPVLTLPLSEPAWTIVSPYEATGNSQGEYIGVSPIWFLTGRSEYDGLASFSNSVQPKLPLDLQNLIDSGNVSGFTETMRLLGIQYVVMNMSDGRDGNYSNVGAAPNGLLEQTESSEFASALAPKIIGRFGPYELRKVSKSSSYPVALTPYRSSRDSSSSFADLLAGLGSSPDVEGCNGWHSDVVSQAINGYDILIQRKSTTKTARCTLVVDLPAASGVTATVVSKQTVTPLRGTLVYGLLQGFELPTSGDVLRVQVAFPFEKLVWLGYAVSIGTWLIVLAAYACKGIRSSGRRTKRDR
jgi:hypothetical protein